MLKRETAEGLKMNSSIFLSIIIISFVPLCHKQKNGRKILIYASNSSQVKNAILRMPYVR